MSADAATWDRCLRLRVEQRRLAPVGECELCDNVHFYGQPRIGSLCTGYGGLDLAVTSVLGGRTIWLSEIEAAPAQVCELRFPRVPNLGDLTAIDWTTTARIDVLTAGYPCQPFSHAGKREGTSDERHLWPHIAECVRVLRPRLVVLENVAGHLDLGFDTVLGDLAEAGFDAEWALVRASEVGACHQRARLFIVATDADRSEWRADARQGRGVVGEGRVQAGRDEAPGRSAELRGAPVADAGSGELQRRGEPRDMGGTPPGAEGPARQRQRVRDTARDGGADVAHADGGGLEVGGEHDGWQGEPGLDAPRRDDVDGLVATLADADDLGCEGTFPAAWRHDERGDQGPLWGDYGPAIERHARVLGRPAPAPVDEQGRLSALFVEWMMMLPAGWVTDVLPSRTKALKCLGNGVVPAQAMYALRGLLARLDERIAA